MIEGPIIDSHVHLWDPRRFRMPWLDDIPELRRAFGTAEYSEDARQLPVSGVVYVQVDVTPAYGLLEARSASYLDALVALGDRIKGVRRLLQSEPDPEFLVAPELIEGLHLLPRYGLSFDICIRHHQLAGTIDMVRACPETQFVLDHLGKPDVRGALLEPWREQMAELASMPNVACKLSGLVTEADHATWTVDDLAPYVAQVLDVFGTDRVMFGGDWPVVRLAATYPKWVETLDKLTTKLSAEAKRKLWSENARRFYRL